MKRRKKTVCFIWKFQILDKCAGKLVCNLFCHSLLPVSSPPAWLDGVLASHWPSEPSWDLSLATNALMSFILNQAIFRQMMVIRPKCAVSKRVAINWVKMILNHTLQANTTLIRQNCQPPWTFIHQLASFTTNRIRTWLPIGMGRQGWR